MEHFYGRGSPRLKFSHLREQRRSFELLELRKIKKRLALLEANRLNYPPLSEKTTIFHNALHWVLTAVRLAEVMAWIKNHAHALHAIVKMVGKYPF